MKRFAVTSITRDKEYDLTKGTANSEVLYFSANPNGEAEVVTVNLRALERLKKLKFDVDFSTLAVKGRDTQGNMVTKYPVKKVELKSAGVSTLGARKIWIDESVKRLNDEDRGKFLGEFSAEDKLLVIQSSGDYQVLSPDLSLHFPDNMISVEKWIPEKPLNVVYFDGEKEIWMVKRFLVEPMKGLVRFITENPKSKLGVATTLNFPNVYVRFNKKFKQAANKMDETISIPDFITVKGLKAIGNKLSNYPVLNVDLLEADMERENRANEEILSQRPQPVAIDPNEPSQSTLF